MDVNTDCSIINATNKSTYRAQILEILQSFLQILALVQISWKRLAWSCSVKCFQSFQRTWNKWTHSMWCHNHEIHLRCGLCDLVMYGFDSNKFKCHDCLVFCGATVSVVWSSLWCDFGKLNPNNCGYIRMLRIRKSFIAHKEFVLMLGAYSTNLVQTTYS